MKKKLLISGGYRKTEDNSGIRNLLKRLDSRPTDRGNDSLIVEFIHKL